MSDEIKIQDESISNKYISLESSIFRGKQNIRWDEVEKYFRKYYGNSYVNKKYNDEIIINYVSADEYTESKYTKKLRGSLAKVKANIVQILPQLIENAVNRRWIENKNSKHEKNAIKGWYRYDVFFSVKVKGEDEEIYRLNYYRATLLVRINDYGKFLYDIINIKKEASTPRES